MYAYNMNGKLKILIPILAISTIIFLFNLSMKPGGFKDKLESRYNEVKKGVTVTTGKLELAKNTVEKKSDDQESAYNESNSELETFTKEQENSKKKGEEGLIQTKTNISADQQKSIQTQNEISREKKEDISKNVENISNNLQTVKDATKSVGLHDKDEIINNLQTLEESQKINIDDLESKMLTLITHLENFKVIIENSEDTLTDNIDELYILKDSKVEELSIVNENISKKKLEMTDSKPNYFDSLDDEMNIKENFTINENFDINTCKKIWQPASCSDNIEYSDDSNQTAQEKCEAVLENVWISSSCSDGKTYTDDLDLTIEGAKTAQQKCETSISNNKEICDQCTICDNDENCNQSQKDKCTKWRERITTKNNEREQRKQKLIEDKKKRKQDAINSRRANNQKQAMEDIKGTPALNASGLIEIDTISQTQEELEAEKIKIENEIDEIKLKIFKMELKEDIPILTSRNDMVLNVKQIQSEIDTNNSNIVNKKNKINTLIDLLNSSNRNEGADLLTEIKAEKQIAIDNKKDTNVNVNINVESKNELKNLIDENTTTYNDCTIEDLRWVAANLNSDGNELNKLDLLNERNCRIKDDDKDTFRYLLNPPSTCNADTIFNIADKLVTKILISINQEVQGIKFYITTDRQGNDDYPSDGWNGDYTIRLNESNEVIMNNERPTYENDNCIIQYELSTDWGGENILDGNPGWTMKSKSGEHHYMAVNDSSNSDTPPFNIEWTPREEVNDEEGTTFIVYQLFEINSELKPLMRAENCEIFEFNRATFISNLNTLFDRNITELQNGSVEQQVIIDDVVNGYNDNWPALVEAGQLEQSVIDEYNSQIQEQRDIKQVLTDKIARLQHYKDVEVPNIVLFTIPPSNEEACKERGYESCEAEYRAEAAAILAAREEACKERGFNSCEAEKADVRCKARGYESCAAEEAEAACKERGYESCAAEEIYLTQLLAAARDDDPELLFDMLDRDGDGKLNESELKGGLRLLGIPVTDNEYARGLPGGDRFLSNTKLRRQRIGRWIRDWAGDVCSQTPPDDRDSNPACWAQGL